MSGLLSSAEYLTDLQKQTTTNKEKRAEVTSVESMATDCVHLCNTLQMIIQIRLLDNYAPLNDQLEQQLSRLLNTIFIKLTDSFPLIAIELSKIIQILAMKN